MGGECGGLSLTRNGNVLVALWDTPQIHEYSQYGSVIRVIILNESMEGFQHSIQLPSYQLVVSLGWDESLHRVCIVDMSGGIIQFYGGSKGSGAFQLSYPRDLAVDRYGNVLVADCCNKRVVLCC